MTENEAIKIVQKVLANRNLTYEQAEQYLLNKIEFYWAYNEEKLAEKIKEIEKINDDQKELF